MARQKLIHIHSFVNGKAPSSSTVSFGEIAVNCNSNSPKLYIKTAAASTETTAKIESFSPDSVIDKKFVIVKGDADNSAVLKGGDNQVISEGGVALGEDNIVGLKGWYYSSIYKENDNTISVYLSNEQKAFNSDEDFKTESQIADKSLPNLVEILGVNAVISLVNAGKYDDKFIVIGGSNGVVRLQTIDESTLPFDIITGQSVINYEDYSIYCLSKPDAGIAELGKYSFAVGYNNKTTNGESAAFGYNNHAYGKFSFVEGKDNKAGYASHAEGRSNIASGSISHAEGRDNVASGYLSHVEGGNNIAEGAESHAEGYFTTAKGARSHAEGYRTKAIGESSHAEGEDSQANGKRAHAEGYITKAIGNSSHAEGFFAEAKGGASHAEGYSTTATGEYSHAEGCSTEALGESSHAEGSSTTAEGKWSHAEGFKSQSKGDYSHAEGQETLATNEHSHAEGFKSQAIGAHSHAEGNDTKAEGINSHAEGNKSHSLGPHSHAEGNETKAEGSCAHAEGYKSQALGKYSHAEGSNTITKNEAEHACGKHNSSTQSNDSAQATRFSIGIGASDTNRKNAVEVKRNGDVYIYGVGGYDGTNPDSSEDVATVLSKGITNVTHEELKTLRDNSQLIPGHQYRITDYITTTTQSNTQSAGHQFDIIVVADDVNVLNENARAIQHEGDTYFSNSDLNAWKLKYRLDNDTDRFAWADANKEYTIELPVSDNMRNHIKSYNPSTEVPNTLIAKWWNHPYNGDGFDYYEIINVKMLADDVLMIAYPCGNIPQNGVAFPEFITSSYGYSMTGNAIYLNGQPTECIIDTIPTVFENENGKGVIYYMKDEFNNECPYDFKNIQFARWELSNPVGYRNDYDFENYEDNWIQEETPFDSLKTGFYGLDGSGNVFTYVYNNEDNEYYKYEVEYTISESPTYCYTFGKDTDYSINGGSYGNVIKEYKSSKTIRLNNIVFLGNSCSNNSFGNDCYRNSFGYRCYGNSFGNDCYNNSFGNYCEYNSFGNGCYNNSFGNNYLGNSFGNNCYDNCSEYTCYNNSFGNGCSNNSFGNNCLNNSFGNSCRGNSFGDSCSNNSFGNSCYSNSFGTRCHDNSFGNDCYRNSFGYRCYGNSFGDSCSINSFRTNNSITATLLNYCRYNHFDDGCSYNIVYNTTTTGSNNQLQNININRGVSGTDSKHNTISIDTLNANYEIQVAKNSSGDIKIYCEADLIA